MAQIDRIVEAGSAKAVEPVVFDRDGFLERVMGDEELAVGIVEGFLYDMPAQIEKLASAVAAGDSRLAEQQAQKIEGASANLGGMSLEHVAYGMELAGKAGDAKKLQELMSQLAKQFEILRASLDKSW